MGGSRHEGSVGAVLRNPRLLPICKVREAGMSRRSAVCHHEETKQAQNSGMGRAQGAVVEREGLRTKKCGLGKLSETQGKTTSGSSRSKKKGATRVLSPMLASIQLPRKQRHSGVHGVYGGSRDLHRKGDKHDRQAQRQTDRERMAKVHPKFSEDRKGTRTGWHSK